MALISPKCIGTVARMWGKQFTEEFLNSWHDLVLYNTRHLESRVPYQETYIDYNYARNSWHEMGRNVLVEEACGDWLLMLDTDHMFAPDLLERLLGLRAKYKTTVLSGIYQYKFAPHAPVLNMWTPQGTLTPVVNWDRNAPILAVGSVPGGCLLVDRSVYRRIQKEYGVGPFSIIAGLSEDYSFCKRCHDLGIPVFVAPQVEMHHYMTHILSVRDYAAPTGSVGVTTVDGVIQSPKAETPIPAPNTEPPMDGPLAPGQKSVPWAPIVNPDKKAPLSNLAEGAVGPPLAPDSVTGVNLIITRTEADKDALWADEQVDKGST